MREQVTLARGRQRERIKATSTRQNADMSHRQIREHCRLDEAGNQLLRGTMTELGLSARAHDKVLRMARTIAELDDSEYISSTHLSEAVNYRMLDRHMWT
jgi:magnesium chelatase family protein